MRIHNKIRSPSGLRKRHILLGNNQATNTLLSVPARQFISQLRPSHFPRNRLDYSILIVGSKNDSINVITAAVAFENTRLRVPRNRLLQFLQVHLLHITSNDRHFLVDKHFSTLYVLANLSQSVLVQTLIPFHQKTG